jgi:hypothetical protein
MPKVILETITSALSGYDNLEEQFPKILHKNKKDSCD